MKDFIEFTTDPDVTYRIRKENIIATVNSPTVTKIFVKGIDEPFTFHVYCKQVSRALNDSFKDE